MRADPATLTFTRSVLDGLSVKERETFLAPYLPQSSPISANTAQRDLLTVAEAGDYLRCSRTTLFREEKAKRIQSVRLRGKKLYRIEDLTNALSGRKKEVCL